MVITVRSKDGFTPSHVEVDFGEDVEEETGPVFDCYLSSSEHSDESHDGSPIVQKKPYVPPTHAEIGTMLWDSGNHDYYENYYG